METSLYLRVACLFVATSVCAMSTTSFSDSKTPNSGNKWDRTRTDLLNDPSKVFLLDGGTGEELFAQGVPYHPKLWSTLALFDEEYHSTLQKVHTSFITAGAQAITTNSYGIVPAIGREALDNIGKCARQSGKIAKQAIDESSNKEVLLLGSLGPLVMSYRADFVLKPSEGVPLYRALIEPLQPYVDIWLGETLSCVTEAQLIVDALSTGDDYQRKQPLWLSFTLSEQGCFRDGQAVSSGIPKLLEHCNAKKVPLHAILFNCATPEAIKIGLNDLHSNEKMLQDLRNKHKVLLGVYSNRLTPIGPNWTKKYGDEPQPQRKDLDPSKYSQIINELVQKYQVQLIGGCCGITPAHIDKLRQQFEKSIVEL